MSDDEKDRYGDKLREVEKAREDKFFADRDRELLLKLKAQTGAQEEQSVRELAKMRCPKCGDRLITRTQLEVEMDECPSGHGMWLDTGELQKLMGRETSGWLSRILGRPS
jgi:predicted RNA-binding Zn-ribbon protein involved in translation (DUF1610 family)